MCTESTHSGYLLLSSLVVGCSWTASDGVKDHSSAWEVMKTIYLYIVWPNHAHFPKDEMGVWHHYDIVHPAYILNRPALGFAQSKVWWRRHLHPGRSKCMGVVRFRVMNVMCLCVFQRDFSLDFLFLHIDSFTTLAALLSIVYLKHVNLMLTLQLALEPSHFQDLLCPPLDLDMACTCTCIV